MTKLERLLLYKEGTEVKLSNSGKNLITTCRVVTISMVFSHCNLKFQVGTSGKIFCTKSLQVCVQQEVMRGPGEPANWMYKWKT